jgi:hypothetical protein
MSAQRAATQNVDRPFDAERGVPTGEAGCSEGDPFELDRTCR